MNLDECARLETRDGEPVMLKGVKVSGALRALMFEAKVEQRFCNPGDEHVEVVYTFPLPWGAVLLGVDVQLGDKHLSGAVVEKKRAQARYEEAISEGDAAIMLEKNRDRSYSLNLGNLAPREECVITLRYAQTLQFEQRGLRLLIPTVIAPRYGDAVLDGGLQPHQATSHDLLVEYPFEIELRLYGELAKARVASPSHPISVASTSSPDGNVLTVSLARLGALDRDFVLVLDQLAQDSMAVAARDTVDPDGVVAMLSFCPRIAAPDDDKAPGAIAVKILVDCSGSMAGDSIEAGKRALQAIALQMGKGDRFSLSRFGSSVEHRSRGLWLATETTKLAARRWIGNLEADMGGTEMQGAMVSTFALAQTVASDVLVVTDGEISAIDRTVDTAKASGHRLFVVGIGSSPAESHLRRLAEATGGACDFVAPGEAVEPAVLRMFARLRSPRMTQLSVAWLAGGAPQWMSELGGSVFDGDTINVYAMLKHVPEGDVRLLGTRPGSTLPQQIASVRFDGVVQTGDALPRTAAWQRMRAIVAAGGAQATQIALDYQLVTDQTNFLLVHQRAEGEKATDMPDLHKVPQMLAAGWGGVASVRESHSAHYAASCAAPSAVQFSIARSSTDDFEVPAFLRKQTDDSASISKPRLVASSANADAPDTSFNILEKRYWSESASYSGLSPLGLSGWLRNNPTTAWPKTYAELVDIGIGAALLDWLELSVAGCEEGVLAEDEVVGAFLFVMAQSETHESLVKSQAVLERFKALAQRLKDLMTGGSNTALPRGGSGLVQSIMDGLMGMTAAVWPEAILATGRGVEAKS